MWISACGNKCTEAELRAYLENKGFSNFNLGKIDYIIGQLPDYGFSIMGGNVIYR